MSTRTISSPGVEINEIDLSLMARAKEGTSVFLTGFASQGPTDEIISVGTISEFESIFGTPTNSAEQYLYYSVKQVLQASNAVVNICRLPYGAGGGAGYDNQYTALVFPISAMTETVVNEYGPENPITKVSPITSSEVQYDTSTLASQYSAANYFKVLPPKLVFLTDIEYNTLITNSMEWGKGYEASSFSSASQLSAAGMIIVNPTKFSVNQFSEGNYIVLSDNTDINPSTGYQKVKGIKAVDSSKEYTPVLPGRLNFGLNQTNTAIKSSLTISEVLEGLPSGINFEDQSYVDSLVVSHFKLKSSTYAQDTLLLDYKLMGSYVGSLYKKRSQNNPAGGLPMSFSLENTLNSKTADLKVIINPYISESTGWVDSNGKVLKKVRLAVYDPTDSTTSVEDETRNLYSVGNFKDDSTLRSNDVGNIPKKLSRVLEKIDILDLDIDIMAEAGLGTIWAHACEHPLSTPPADKRFAGLFSSPDGYPDDDGTYFFDDSTPISQTKLDELKRQDLSQTLSDCDLRDNYLKIAEQFRNFAQNVRKDHLFLADPLRCVFVNGKDLRAIKNPDYNFSRDIYWSLKNLFGSLVSSYAATYGNWIKWNDIYQDKEVWLPASGYVAADIADSTAKNFPWSAPAGFNRGLLTNVLDVAVNPTLKQRDQLYKININPIAYFQGDGYVIFGQKTLYNKPSAFDRINVRRLFLHLEKVSKQLLKYYLFEPNTYSTRSRLVAALTPEFAKAKNNDGVYDYKIVCDERNNTPDVIDNNELKLSIYIQPVRTAEFILADFIATRTGVNFDELTA